MDTYTVCLSADEAGTLQRVLRHYLGELRMEIADTDQKDFRDRLKDEEVFIKDLLIRLETPSVSGSTLAGDSEGRETGPHTFGSPNHLS